MPTAVLIVNFHTYDELDRCLGSLQPFFRLDDEIIVVDHESDEVELRRVAGRHPAVTTIPRAENLGFAAGVNLAARHSRAPFLLLLNPDTVVEGPVPAVLEDWLVTHPGTGVVGPRVLNADGSVQPSARRFPGLTTLFGGRSAFLTRRFPNNWFSRRNLIARDAARPVDADWISGACFMTRRESFDRLGGLDEGFFLYWEDADYCLRIGADGSRCTYLPTVTVRHVGGTSAQHDLARAIRAFHASAYRLYRKHSGLPGRLAAPFVRAGLFLRGEVRLAQARRAAAHGRGNAARARGSREARG